MRYTLARVRDTYQAVLAQREPAVFPERRPDPSHVHPAEQVLLRGTEKDRVDFHTASKVWNWNSYVERHKLAKRLELQCAVGRLLKKRPYTDVILPSMPRKTGLRAVKPRNFKALDAAIAEARGVFQEYKPGTMAREKDSLEGVPRTDRSWKSAINRLATHPEVLRIASNYLNMFPILYRINLLYSPNSGMVESSSQYWHLDPEDIMQVKIFIWVEDVDENTGPFAALPADKSQIVRRALNYKSERVFDEQLRELGVEGDVQTFTGEAGTMVFCDTNRCFHMGSRTGNRPRYAIMLQYVTPLASMFPLVGELPPPMVGHAAVPPKLTLMDEYLFAKRR